LWDGDWFGYRKKILLAERCGRAIRAVYYTRNFLPVNNQITLAAVIGVQAFGKDGYFCTPI